VNNAQQFFMSGGYTTYILYRYLYDLLILIEIDPKWVGIAMLET
jgi:hypothetical protein